MRHHRDIIRAVGNTELVAEKCGVSINTARSWVQRNRIPDDQWMTFSREGWATLDELALAVDRRAGDVVLGVGASHAVRAVA